MRIEGVTYEIDWKEFKRGTSLFFPCLDGARAREQLFSVTDRLQIPVYTLIQHEEGIKGLRVWRM
jgi:hypothetical protein